MKIGVIMIGFPYRTESFSRREVCALRDLGHEVMVFARQPVGTHPASEMPKGVAIRSWEGLRLSSGPLVDVFYTGIGFPVHEHAVKVSRETGIPFVLRIWSGLDTFTHPAPKFYSVATADPLCLGCIVEDALMVDWAVTKMGIPREKLSIVPNSLDLSIYKPRVHRDPPLVLAIGRMVEKKGFIHLARAMKLLKEPTEVWYVGEGPELPKIQALKTPDSYYLGTLPETDLPDLYAKAACLVAPCVKAGNGDMDGIPTVVLEAMAAGCPVITSRIGSAEHYIAPETGILVTAGNEKHIRSAIETVLEFQKICAVMADAAQAWARANLDITKNIKAIESVLLGGDKSAKWQAGVDHIAEARKSYTPERLKYYAEQTQREFDFFKFQPGSVLDVGCGDGCPHLFPKGSYQGVDVVQRRTNGFPFELANAENLPFDDEEFHNILCRSVLQHVQNPERALAEMARVLVHGGRLCLEVCLGDGNPIFIRQFKQGEVLDLTAQHFKIDSHTLFEKRLLCVNAVKA